MFLCSNQLKNSELLQTMVHGCLSPKSQHSVVKKKT